MRIQRHARLVALAGLAALAAAGPVWAQQLMIYPEKGQSPQQQQQDRGACHAWSVQQSGFDPAAPRAAAPPPPQTGPQGQVLRGAARGAAVGAVGGAITGDAGRGAAAGAAMGGLIGGMRRADQNRAQQQQYEQAVAQQQASQAQGMDGYNRALSACLAGRGYTVR